MEIDLITEETNQLAETRVPKLHGIAGLRIKQANRLIHVARRMKARHATKPANRSRSDEDNENTIKAFLRDGQGLLAKRLRHTAEEEDIAKQIADINDDVEGADLQAIIKAATVLQTTA